MLLSYKSRAFIIVLLSSNYKASSIAVNRHPLYWCWHRYNQLWPRSPYLVASNMYYPHVTCRESAWRRHDDRYLHTLQWIPPSSDKSTDVLTVSQLLMKDGRHICLYWEVNIFRFTVFVQGSVVYLAYYTN